MKWKRKVNCWLPLHTFISFMNSGLLVIGFQPNQPLFFFSFHFHQFNLIQRQLNNSTARLSLLLRYSKGKERRQEGWNGTLEERVKWNSFAAEGWAPAITHKQPNSTEPQRSNSAKFILHLSLFVLLLFIELVLFDGRGSKVYYNRTSFNQTYR